MSQSPSLLVQAHQHIRPHLYPGAIAIDATVGNGHDSLFLAQHIAPSGKLYGFDIQSAAIQATQSRLQAAQLAEFTELFTASHAQLAQLIPVSAHGSIQAIMFNLGYLPGTDKNIVTQSPSTLAALNASVKLLSATGILSILAYPGHPGGSEETQAVTDWLAQLPSAQFNCEVLLSSHPHASAPQLFLVQKRPDTPLGVVA